MNPAREYKRLMRSKMTAEQERLADLDAERDSRETYLRRLVAAVEHLERLPEVLGDGPIEMPAGITVAKVRFAERNIRAAALALKAVQESKFPNFGNLPSA